MNLRCDRCGELIWFTDGSELWLRCNSCGKTVENPFYEKREETNVADDNDDN